MRPRLGTGLAIGAGALVVLAATLFTSGLRVVFDGGRGLHFRFPESPEAHARTIERDREAQRARPAPASAPASGSAPAPDLAASTNASATAAAGTEAASLTAPAPYWTDFRGPNRDGNYRERPILTAWPAAGLTPIWKQPVGEGYASFVVARGRAFTIEQRAAKEVVAAYDVLTGREMWAVDWPTRFSETMGGDGPRATPTWSDGLVYALGAAGEAAMPRRRHRPHSLAGEHSR